MSILTRQGREERPSPISGWVKSSLSFANGNCVEVADLPGGEVGVRHSKHADGPVLRFTPDEWRAFIGGVRNGEFDTFGNLSVIRAVRTSALLWLAVREMPGGGPSNVQTEGPPPSHPFGCVAMP